MHVLHEHTQNPHHQLILIFTGPETRKVRILRRIKVDDRVLKIASAIKDDISAKYKLIDFRVFGSTARGIQDRESDIDILVVLDRVDRQIEEELFDIAYDSELKYDCLIDLIAFGKDALSGKISYAPVYVRAMEEGVAI